MAKKRKVATKRVTRKPARKRSVSPDATINTLVILVVIVMVLGGLFLYAQNKKQAALWPSIMEAIAKLPAPPLAAVIGDPESTGSVQPSQPAIEAPRPTSAIEAPQPATVESPRPTSAIEALQPTSAAEAPPPAPSIETSQSTSDDQTSQPETRPGTPQTTGSFQAPKPQAHAGAPEATGRVQSAKRRAATRKVRKPVPYVEPPQPSLPTDTVAARTPNID
jgi:FtsZ-interacting cell division protein ZipA